MDGQAASAAASLGPEQVYSGGTYYFGGKRRGRATWAIGPRLQLLPLCLGHVIMSYLLSTPRNNASLSAFIECGNVEWIEMTNYDLKCISLR